MMIVPTSQMQRHSERVLQPYRFNQGGSDEPRCYTITPNIVFCPLACQIFSKLVYCSCIEKEKMRLESLYIRNASREEMRKEEKWQKGRVQRKTLE